jgi:hypothetical protein
MGWKALDGWMLWINLIQLVLGCAVAWIGCRWGIGPACEHQHYNKAFTLALDYYFTGC